LELPVRDDASFAWYVKVLTVRCLVFEGIVLLAVSPWLGFARPMSLVGLLGLLVIIYFGCLARRRGRIKLWSDLGCAIHLVLLVTGLLVGAGSILANHLGLSSEYLVETAWGQFAVLAVLAPAIYHWNVAEQYYYQLPIARRLERDLGFTSETNTLEGSWPTGRKYLFFQLIEPGGLVNQAGVRPHDIVVEPRGFTEFWYRLEQARGGEPVTIAVVSWSDPIPVSRRPRRQLRIRVPPDRSGWNISGPFDDP
jgi:hypothetical protein